MIAPRTIIEALQQDTIPTQQAETKHTAPSTGDSVPEYWVTRVVRKMKGCSPSRIDSVIQANLPPRKIRWSQCPDTLEIPGLEGRIAYTIDNLPNCYELGYFRDNQLLHPELVVKAHGIPTRPQPYQPKQDNIINCVLILCFVLLSIIIHRTRAFLRFQAHEFFHPSKKKDTHTDSVTTISTGSTLLTYVLLGTVGSILFFYHAQNQYNLFLCNIPQHYLIGIYLGVFIGFFTLKKIMSSFINWIFFDKTSRQEWRLSYNFLLIHETALLLAITALGIYSNCTANTLLYSALLVVGAFKIILLYKTYTTFLFKLYCFLHLLSYLCALEIIPLIALRDILTNITEVL